MHKLNVTTFLGPGRESMTPHSQRYCEERQRRWKRYRANQSPCSTISPESAKSAPGKHRKHRTTNHLETTEKTASTWTSKHSCIKRVTQRMKRHYQRSIEANAPVPSHPKSRHNRRIYGKIAAETHTQRVVASHTRFQGRPKKQTVETNHSTFV